MLVLKSDDSFVKSPIIPDIKNAEIIKEFLYQCLSGEHREHLDTLFTNLKGCNASRFKDSSIDIAYAEIKIKGCITTIPDYLKDLESHDKCFLLPFGDRAYPITKIPY